MVEVISNGTKSGKATEDQRRQSQREAVRKYRVAHPGRSRIFRLRDAKRLLEKAGFTVSGGLDLTDIYQFDGKEGGDP